MRKFLTGVCFLATIFDGICVMLGWCVAVKGTTIPAYIMSGVAALIIVALMFSCKDIFDRKDSLHRVMRLFLTLAILVNIGSVILAGSNHIILAKPLLNSSEFDWAQVYDSSIPQLITIGVLTIFLTAAPIATSYLWPLVREEEDAELSNEKPSSRERVAA